MAHSEIDSFVMKFKQIMHSGKKVDLNIKSEAGKAVINLTVEVDVPLQPQRSAQPRNGPARQRRREKRAAARDAADSAAGCHCCVVAEAAVVGATGALSDCCCCGDAAAAVGCSAAATAALLPMLLLQVLPVC